jgi:tetratricopeptide (TPR) repeat protein
VEAPTLAKQISDEIKAFMNLGLKHTQGGRYREAEKCFRQALAIVDLIEFQEGRAMVLYNWSNMYYVAGQYTDALQTVSEALQAASKAGMDETAYRRMIHVVSLMVQKEALICLKEKRTFEALARYEVCVACGPEEKRDEMRRQMALIGQLAVDG